MQSNVTDPESAKMKTSHGVIQGYTGVAAVDEKHQVIVDAKAFGQIHEAEHVPEVIDSIEQQFKRLDERLNIFDEVVLTADTGFNSEASAKAVLDRGIDAYFADTGFRKRDPRFANQQEHRAKTVDPHGTNKVRKYFAVEDFHLDEQGVLICPAGKPMKQLGNPFVYRKKGYTGREYYELRKNCTFCPLRTKCIRGKKSQVRGVKILESAPTATNRMIRRFDSKREQCQGRRNRAVVDQFEPGSTMKPFTVAAALEAGLVKPGTLIDTTGGQMTIGRYTIHDAHPDGVLTVAQVLQKSSNVGAAKMALSLPPEAFWDDLSADGFGEPTGSGFPGEAGRKLRDYKTWRPIEQATMAYGNGISVNLLQLARAYTAFANEGMLLPVSLLKLSAPPQGTRVFSAATAREVRDMLELVVKPGGTAPLAQISGYRVAGKTGTAHKLENGRYVDHYVASFVGMAPASNPRLIVAVKIDDPQGTQYYGGEVAAPVFSTVMSQALHMLGVPNDAPLDNVIKPTGEIVKEDT